MKVQQQRKHLRGLRLEDWFHVALRYSTGTSVFWLLFIWTAFIVLFALLFQWVDVMYSGTDCGLGKLPFGGYFAFSLETTTTVGYGLPGSTNAFFENCPGIQFVIYLQMVWSMLYNAFLFAFFFSRLGRCEARASQVIFSNKAVVRRNESTGKWEFRFRVSDIDAAHPIVEAHVRVYVRKGSELIPLRLLKPDDDNGAVLFLSWPTVIVHEIDHHSPLHPPPDPTAEPPKYQLRLRGEGLHLREVDSKVANREEVICPVCSETYGTIERLRAHVKYNAIVEKHDDIPVEGSHQEVDMNDLVLPPEPTIEQVRDGFPFELVVLVEGIDPLMSGTFQALQSYTKDDIVWEGRFVDCILPKADGSKHVMCLEHFQQVEGGVSTADADGSVEKGEEEIGV